MERTFVTVELYHDNIIFTLTVGYTIDDGRGIEGRRGRIHGIDSRPSATSSDGKDIGEQNIKRSDASLTRIIYYIHIFTYSHIYYAGV